MSTLFEKILNSLKNKKKVSVKSHIRRVPKGFTLVKHYEKYIKEKDEEDKKDEDVSVENEYEDPLEKVVKEDIDENIELTTLEKESIKDIDENEIKRLISEYKKVKDENILLNLLDHYDKLLKYHVNKYKTTSIPYDLILLEAKKWFIKAVDTYNPSKKANFSTHLTNYLRKLYRFVGINQNIAKIPEQRIRKINTYKYVFANLENKLGREPTDAEMADELSWSIKEVQRLRNELQRHEILNFGEDYSFGDLGITSNKLEQALKIVYYSGSKEEQFIIEHMTKLFNKKQMTIDEICKKLKLNKNQVNKIINKIKLKVVELI